MLVTISTLSHYIWVMVGSLPSNKLTVEDLVLICFCAPKKCHGDVIKAAIEWYINKIIGINNVNKK